MVMLDRRLRNTIYKFEDFLVTWRIFQLDKEKKLTLQPILLLYSLWNPNSSEYYWVGRKPIKSFYS